MDPKGDQTTPEDAPTPPFGDPKSMVAKNMIFDELWGANQRDPKWIIVGAKRRRKTHQEIDRKSVSKKLQF